MFFHVGIWVITKGKRKRPDIASWEKPLGRLCLPPRGRRSVIATTSKLTGDQHGKPTRLILQAEEGYQAPIDEKQTQNDQTRTYVREEGSNASGSLPRPEIHAVTSGGREQEGGGSNADGESVGSGVAVDENFDRLRSEGHLS